jgi:hypothetical protein
MRSRQAKKIAKSQAIDCRCRIDGPATIRTGGRVHYAESQYRNALSLYLRKLDREATERAPGAIERCAALNQKLNSDRLSYLLALADDWTPVPLAVEVGL